MTGFFFDLGDTPIIDPTGTLPIVYSADPLLTAGSLILIDFNHSMGFSPDDLTAIPVNGSIIPNIARDIAVDVVGSGVASDYNLTFAFNAAANQVVMERTERGMLHGMVSQTNLTATVAGSMALPLNIRQYLLDNQGNEIYLSVWSVLTRSGGNSATRQTNIGSSSSAANNYLATTGSTSLFPTTGNAHLIGRQLQPGAPALDDQTYRAVASDGFTGTVPANATSFAQFIPFGRTAGFTAISNGFDSWAVGRVHLIDLTVAGVSWADMNERDLAAFNAAIAVGGKFYNDSWSDPSTVVP